MQIGKTQVGFGVEELPELDPILACEGTKTGWRALTRVGEVLAVKSDKPIAAGDKMTFVNNGEPIGARIIPEPNPGAIDRYLRHYNRGVELYKNNDLELARNEFETTLTVADTALARWNYGLVLLSLGEWKRGLQCYEVRHQFRPIPNGGAPSWQGEDLTDKLLILDHELGFGDTIMLLRYVPILQERCRVFLNMPPVLERLAEQLAPITRFAAGIDLSCPMMSLLERLNVRPQNVPHAPYLQVEAELVERWQHRLLATEQLRIGIAWSVGNVYPDDYPRSIPLALLVARIRKLRGRDIEIYSVQPQGGDEAELMGVHAMPFEDFADCAALMSMMDEIWTVDTAALHLAGAIGHERIIGLLSWWHSWRWKAQWYPNVQMIVQDRPGDWPSALSKIL